MQSNHKTLSQCAYLYLRSSASDFRSRGSVLFQAESMGPNQAVGLEEKADCPAATLSGGSKRKLQVGIALLADSRIVLLDEPSSGA